MHIELGRIEPQAGCGSALCSGYWRWVLQEVMGELIRLSILWEHSPPTTPIRARSHSLVSCKQMQMQGVSNHGRTQ